MGNEDIVCKNKCCSSDDLADIERGKRLESSTNKNDGDVKINFVQILPMELIEEILLYLSPKELAAASAVCSGWREAVNSNKVWGQLCERKGWKENFDPNFSHFLKSHKQFRRWAHSYDSFAHICQKRLLYNKHSDLLKNWRVGKYVVHKISSETSIGSKNCLQLFEPVTCDGKYLVLAEYSKFNFTSTTLAVWSLDGLPTRLCDLPLPTPFKPIEALAFELGTIVFIQDWLVVVFKLVGQTFEMAYQITDLKPLAPVGRLPNSMKRLKPFLKVTQENIICVPSQSHSTTAFLPIFFWDRETGKQKSTLNFDSMYYHITNALWLGESCYLVLANKKIKSYQVVEFGMKTANWEYFSQNVPSPVEQIIGNDKYILAVSKNSGRDPDMLLSRSEITSKELWLWDRATGSSVKKFTVNGKGFQFVENYLMFFDSALLTVMNLKDTNIRNEFEISGTISSIKACHSPSVLVVIKTGCYIEVWDWGLGSRLYTVTAETGYGSQVWCDDKRIITYQSEREEGVGIMVLGLW